MRRGKPIRTEIDVAYEWEQQRMGGPRPMLAVTGTDGKTTTTMMAAAMLRCAGLKVAAVGNTELPLIAALETDVDVLAHALLGHLPIRHADVDQRPVAMASLKRISLRND